MKRDDAELASVVETNFIETWWTLAGVAGERHEAGGVRWFTGGDHPLLNAVIETRLTHGTARLTIEATAQALLAVTSSAVWWVLPGSKPSVLADELVRSGFKPWGDPWPGMALELDKLVEPSPVVGVDVERVHDEQGLEEYLSVFDRALSPGPAFTAAFQRWALSDGFGPSAVGEHFVARDGTRAVSCASLIVAGGAAGMYNVATLEEARRRGIGAWISAVALLRGRRRGVRLGMLQASARGYPVYERLGFRTVASLAPYIRTRPETGAAS